MAARLKDVTDALGIPLIFKASYDKANRSSLGSYRGPGMERGLEILAKVRERYDVPILTDVHEVGQVEKAAAVVDVLQIPAFLCRQTDLVLAAARSGKIVNIKKGQFMAPLGHEGHHGEGRLHGEQEPHRDGARVQLRVQQPRGGHAVVPTLRSFGYPVVYDITHSVQRPGGLGDRSGGEAHFIDTLGPAGVAAGVDGLFMEVHENPARALSDGPNAYRLGRLKALLKRLMAIHAAAAN